MRINFLALKVKDNVLQLISRYCGWLVSELGILVGGQVLANINQCSIPSLFLIL
jgi:hypothetical protein